MPWTDRERAMGCLRSAMIDIDDVDNSVTNRGVSRSWNMGIDKMERTDADWLIVLSSAVRFGVDGGMDFLQILEDKPEFHVIQPLATYGWHMVAFSRKAVEVAGRFDENFWPGYYEDIDYSIRLQRGGIDPNLRGGFACDVTDLGMAHSTNNGVKVNDAALLSYFETKWGSVPCGDWDAYHALPWKRFPLAYWPHARMTKGQHDQRVKETL
jgi:hypothetical protein